MQDAIRLDSMTENVLGRRCAPGVRIIHAAGAELADVSGGRLIFLPGVPGTVSAVPPAGRWMAVTRREVALAFTLKDALLCAGGGQGGIPLSLRCTLRACVVHATGLAPLLRKFDTLRTADVENVLRPPLEAAAKKVCHNYFDETPPAPRLILQSRAPLEAQLEKAAFPILYELGLLITGDSLRIEGFTAPEIRD